MRNRGIPFLANCLIITWVGLWPLMSCAADAPLPARAGVHDLLVRDLLGLSGKEVLMETVDFLPGAQGRPHRHNAQVFVYVLEGSVRMQVQGGPEVTLGPGDTFYEAPDDIHTVSANASDTKPAKILVVMVKDKGAPSLVPLTRPLQP
jgi:quercetin dioxygenase-like cupin family protein